MEGRRIDRLLATGVGRKGTYQLEESIRIRNPAQEDESSRQVKDMQVATPSNPDNLTYHLLDEYGGVAVREEYVQYNIYIHVYCSISLFESI